MPDVVGAPPETFIGSREKSDNGYGQNGFDGASSDLAGDPQTKMNRDFGLSADPTSAPGDWQTRAVKADAYAPAFGMKPANGVSTFPTNNVRKATTRGPNGNFQR